MPDFVGGDPESNASECPAVFLDSETGDFLFRGKTVTDPALTTALNEHIGKAEDESDVWLPARMAPLIREALDGYEQNRQGPGQHGFAELLARTHRSVIRFEMRDSYDPTDQGFAEWQATGDIGAYEWGDHLDVVRAAVARGVTIRAGSGWYLSRYRITCGGSMPAPTPTSAPARASAGCPVPKLPTCCCPAPTAGYSTTGSCGGTPSAAMARTRVTTPSAQTPVPFATSWRRSRWHGAGRHRTTSTRPIRNRRRDSPPATMDDCARGPLRARSSTDPSDPRR